MAQRVTVEFQVAEQRAVRQVRTLELRGEQQRSEIHAWVANAANGIGP